MTATRQLTWPTRLPGTPPRAPPCTPASRWSPASEARQWLYPAMTRGTDANLAFVFTTPARPADPQPGTRPAPELNRYGRIRREHAGYSPPPSPSSPPGRSDQREPIAVLADVLSRDGAEQSASAIRQLNLANADHLATLHAIWVAETAAARHDRYRDLVTAALPPGHRQPVSYQARWLYRTLHAAELAGLDPAEVIRTAITSRDLAGSRDIAAVLDARIRPRINPLLPQPQDPWTRRVPQLPDPDRHAYLAQIAAMMDDRTRRLGQHTARTGPAWATQRSRPGARRSSRTPELGTQGRLYRGVPRDVRIRPSRRPDRPRTQPRSPGPAGRLAPGLRRPRPGRQTRRPGHARRAAVAGPRQLRRRRPPGHPATSEKSCGCPGSAPSTPPLAPSAPTPKPTPPARPATTTAPRGTSTWPPATAPCATTTSSKNRPSPGPWPTGRNGSMPPPLPGAWPSPPTPNCAAATLPARSSRCAPANQPLSAALNASSRTRPRTASAPRRRPGSATWRYSVRRSAPRWTNARA